MSTQNDEISFEGIIWNTQQLFSFQSSFDHGKLLGYATALRIW